jgi:hypothetical protein
VSEQSSGRAVSDNVLCLGAYLALFAELALGNARILGAMPVSFWIGGPGLGERLAYLGLWLVPMAALSPWLLTPVSVPLRMTLAALAFALMVLAGLITNALFSSPASALGDFVVFALGVGSVAVLAVVVPFGLWAWRRAAANGAAPVGAAASSSWTMFIAGALMAIVGVGFYFAQRGIDPTSDGRMFSRLGVLAMIAILPSALFVIAWRNRESTVLPRGLSAIGFGVISAWLMIQQ